MDGEPIVRMKAMRNRVLALLFIFTAFTAIAAEPEAQPAPRTIVLVRHGDYVADPQDSVPGPGLSPLGMAQAKLASARLAAMPDRFDVLYASPLTRAAETAALIASDLEMRVATVSQLAECTPRTRRKEIIEKDRPEDLAACATRLDALFRERFVPARGTPRREIMVAHGNVIRYLVTRSLGVDTEAWLGMSVAHTSITTVLVEADGRFKVLSVGDIGHIPPNLQTGATGMTGKALTVPK